MSILEDLTPADLGMPSRFKDFRPIQDQAAEYALYGPTGDPEDCRRFHCLGIPPGGGKSLLGHVIGALAGQGKYACLTATKSLEDQQVRDGFDLVNVRGRNNYQCFDKRVQEACSLERKDATCEAGEEEGCRYYGTPRCTYGGVVEDARRSGAVLTNYMYWMTARGVNPNALERPIKESYEYFDGDVKTGTKTVGTIPFNLLICDEAHLIPQQVSKFLGVWVSNAQLRKYANEEVRDVLAKSKGAEWGKVGDGWLFALGMATGKIRDEKARIVADNHGKSEEELKRTSKVFRQLERLLTNIERVVLLGNDNNWIWKHEGAGVKFECIWPAKYTERFLWTRIPKIVLMSATLRPKSLQLAGIPSSQRWFKEWPRIFPARLSPVYYVPTGRMGYRVSEEEKIKSVERMDEMARLWEGRRGIVHTPSFALTEYLYEKSTVAKRIIAHTRDKKAADVEKKYRDTPGAILISPSFHTGSDFADESCEWMHIPKLPFPDKSDAVVIARCEDDKDWYSSECMQRVVQTCGRGSRHEEDPCTTAITDDVVRNFRYYAADAAPRWFKIQDAKDGKMPGPPSWLPAPSGK